MREKLMTMPPYNGPKGHPVPSKPADDSGREAGKNATTSVLSPISARASDEEFHSHLHNTANDLYGHGVPRDFLVIPLKAQG